MPANGRWDLIRRLKVNVVARHFNFVALYIVPNHVNSYTDKTGKVL